MFFCILLNRLYPFVSRLLHITTKHFIFNIYHGGQSVCNCGCKCYFRNQVSLWNFPRDPKCAVNECGISLTINMVSTTWLRPVLHSWHFHTSLINLTLVYSSLTVNDFTLTLYLWTSVAHTSWNKYIVWKTNEHKIVFSVCSPCLCRLICNRSIWKWYLMSNPLTQTSNYHNLPTNTAQF